METVLHHTLRCICFCNSVVHGIILHKRWVTHFVSNKNWRILLLQAHKSLNTEHEHKENGIYG